MPNNNNVLNKDEFYRKMEALLKTPPGSVQGEQSLKTLKDWDSLMILEFMVLADSDYNSDVQPAEIAACKTVDELAQVTLARSSRSE